jgi:hypothetical protein
MKRAFSRILFLSLIAVGLICAAGDGLPSGAMPITANCAFYTSAFKCIYTKPAKALGLTMEPNAWNHYEVTIENKTLDYNGNGSLNGFSIFRIQTKTPTSQIVAMYIDNMKLVDPAGAVVWNIDFEDGNNRGTYVSAGSPLEGCGKVVDLDGKKVFLLYGKTKNVYNNVQLEHSWNIADLTDGKVKTLSMGKGGYVLSYDYFYKVSE